MACKRKGDRRKALQAQTAAGLAALLRKRLLLGFARLY